MLCAGLWTGGAAAGAWPREPGHGFVSLGLEITALRDELNDEEIAARLDGYRTFYAELGLGPRVTIGIDAGGDETDLTGDVEREFHRLTARAGLPPPDRSAIPRLRTWSNIVFIRYALSAPEDRHKFAVQLGAGRRRYTALGRYLGQLDARNENILRPALAYGTSFTVKDRPGWVSVEASIEFREDSVGEARKLDATLGVSGKGRFTYMLQVQSGDFPQSSPYVKLLPGVVIGLTHGLSLESSLIWGLRGDDSVGGRLALWWEF